MNLESLDKALIHLSKDYKMEKLIQEMSSKLKEFGVLFQSKRKLQYGVLALYLLLWLLSSGSLTTTIWVAVGAGLGWMIGHNNKKTP